MWTSMKVSINARTEQSLQEIMRLTNQTNLTHTLNVMTSAFLESLKSSNHASTHIKKGSARNDREA